MNADEQQDAAIERVLLASTTKGRKAVSVLLPLRSPCNPNQRSGPMGIPSVRACTMTVTRGSIESCLSPRWTIGAAGLGRVGHLTGTPAHPGPNSHVPAVLGHVQGARSPRGIATGQGRECRTGTVSRRRCDAPFPPALTEVSTKRWNNP